MNHELWTMIFPLNRRPTPCPIKRGPRPRRELAKPLVSSVLWGAAIHWGRNLTNTTTLIWGEDCENLSFFRGMNIHLPDFTGDRWYISHENLPFTQHQKPLFWGSPGARFLPIQHGPAGCFVFHQVSRDDAVGIGGTEQVETGAWTSAQQNAPKGKCQAGSLTCHQDFLLLLLSNGFLLDGSRPEKAKGASVGALGISAFRCSTGRPWF